MALVGCLEPPAVPWRVSCSQVPAGVAACLRRRQHQDTLQRNVVNNCACVDFPLFEVYTVPQHRDLICKIDTIECLRAHR